MARIHAVFDQRRPVGLDTNFFEAGLSSATLAEILTDLGQLGLTCTLIDLYRYPTVRQLTAATRPDSTPATSSPLPWLASG
ncbi:hypothetical protein GCM10022225_07900 [Plantactinospora mayteni]|uniref:Carrier domain-containing protein n=2 Tax=Plantactinospora mayteni TaxID=566021 RepID=A0ABQ4EIA6_9ACTN|nr:hypothetical protein Pma05_10370 [Plantactinospora mayteni]